MFVTEKIDFELKKISNWLFARKKFDVGIFSDLKIGFLSRNPNLAYQIKPTFRFTSTNQKMVEQESQIAKKNLSDFFFFSKKYVS